MVLGRRRLAEHARRAELDATGADGMGGLFGLAAAPPQTRGRRRRRGRRGAGGDNIDPDRLRYLFWDSECAMREDGGALAMTVGEDGEAVPQPAEAAAAMDQHQPANEEGREQQQPRRQFHDPLLVIGELLCVPCMRVGYGILNTIYNDKKI